MTYVANLIVFLVSFVLVFQPAIEVVLERNASRAVLGWLEPLRPSRAAAQTGGVIPLPSPLQLTRTLSAHSVDTAAGGEVTVSYHAVNVGTESVEDVLVVTTLAPGVTLLESTPPAEISGSTLAILLPSILQDEMQTATLRLGLPGGSGPAVLDEGADAFGSLRTREATASLDPTVLPATLGVDPSLLDPTPDAKADDVDTQRYVAEVGCDGGDIFDFVKNRIGYEAYRGSLRGSRGTLWSMAGNALDQASTLIAMLRACGIPSRYAVGRLDPSRAQQLIRSMFREPTGVVGGLDAANVPGLDGLDLNTALADIVLEAPGADEISDPENDPELLETAQRHAWVELWDGAGFVAADPTFADSNLGDTFASTDATYAEIPDSMRHRVRIELVEEEYPVDLFNGILAAAYHLDPSDELVRNGVKPVGDVFVQEVKVLEHTLPTASMVGEVLSIRHLVKHEVFFSTVEFIFNTYSPMLQIGRDGEVIRGDDYREAMSTIVVDLAKLVTGLFVRATMIDPDGNETLHEYTYHDRFGLAQRLGEEPIGPPDLSGDTILSEVNVMELSFPVSRIDHRVGALAIEASEAAVTEMMERFPTAQTDDLSTYSPEDIRDFKALTRETFAEVSRFDLASISAVWDAVLRRLAQFTGVRAYLSEPQFFVSSTHLRDRGGDTVFGQATDLRKFDVNVIPYPGERMSTAFMTRALSGQALSIQETASLVREADPSLPAFGAMDILAASAADGIPIRMIGPGNQLDVDTLDVSPEARARIRLALGSDKTVIVPASMVTIDGTTTTAWIETDMTTGDTIAVAADGGHQGAIDYGLIVRDTLVNLLGFLSDALGIFGVLVTLYLDLPKKLEACQNSGKSCGMVGPKALGGSLAGIFCGWGLSLMIPALLGGPIGWIGALLIAIGCVVFGLIFGEILDDLAGDPPLSTRGIRSFGAAAASSDVEEVSATATLPAGPGAVAGTVQADHTRVAGELDAPNLPAAMDGALSLFPSALSGLGASGSNGAGLNFAPSTIATAVGAQLNLDFASGSLAYTGDTLAGPGNIGFTGFDGAVDASDDGATDRVAVDGSYERVLVVELDQTSASASHDSGASFQTTLHSNADDDYFLVGRAPGGWNVEVAPTGVVTFTPPFGLPAGMYEVRITAVAEELIAEATATIDVAATPAGALGVQIVEDSVYNVPQHGTFVFSNYRLEIFNGGLMDDVFDVSFSGPAASDFTAAASQVFIPAGQTGFVGVAFHPVGGLLPAGTPVSFTGSATGRDFGLSGSASGTFPYPDVVGVLPSFAPFEVFGAPGDVIPVDLSLEGTGNGPSTFTLDVSNPFGLQVAGIPGSETVAAGATDVLPVTVTIPSAFAPGTPAALAVTADLCNGLAPEDCDVPLPSTRTAYLGVSVGSSDALCLLDAAQRSIRGPDLGVASTLASFGIALSELSLDTADTALQSRALSAGNAVLVLLVEADLRSSSTALSALLAEIASGDAARVGDALTQMCVDLAPLPSEMETEADKFNFGFQISLAPSSLVVQPGDPAVYTLRLASTGSQTTPLDLSLSGLAGVLSQTSVTLAPGEVLDENSASPITVTIESPTPVTGAQFMVDAVVTTRPAVTGQTTGLFAAVEGAIDVAAVTPNPSAVEAAGDPLNVTADLLNRINQARDVLVTWRIEDAGGALLFTGSPVATRVGTGSGATSVVLGSVDTSGFPDGVHTIIAQLTTPDGDPIPGRQGRGVFFVGLPFSAAAEATPSIVPPGSSESVTSSVIVAPQAVVQVGGFADQFADAVASSSGSTDDAEAVGPPDGDVAMLPVGAQIVLDMGAGTQRIGDGVGDDLVIFEREPDTCVAVHDEEYEVAVSESPAGPFTVLGTASGNRTLGDGFDLADVGLTTARYVRITSLEADIGIDAVLAAHTVNPNHIQIEHHAPVGDDTGVASTPVIGDVDEDGSPEVFFTVQSGSSQCEAIGIDGVTKAEDFRQTYPAGCAGGIGSCFCGNSSSPALGDIDLDGSPEVVLYQTVQGPGFRLTAYDADGTEIMNFNPPRNGTSINPVIEDVDGDNALEILWPGGYLEQDGTQPLNRAVGGQPIAVDIDDDGDAELVMRLNWGFIRAFESDGTEIWSADLAGLTSSFSRGAVADLDGDGKPDIVVGHEHDFGTQRKLTALRGEDGTILWQLEFDDAIGTCSQTGDLCGGPHPACTGLFNSCSTLQTRPPTQPTIADLDGDGEPELATFIRRWDGLEDHVVAFDGDGTFLWSTEAIDPGGAPPGVSSADLNGDGKAEVLWNGWCDGFTVFDGMTGAILYRDPRAASASGGDSPTAGDVDNDGHIEVATGGIDGLYIFGADLDWGPGRSVWNHIDYHVTNVNDDLTIPTSKAPHWLSNNTYRSQTAVGFGGTSAEVTVTHDLTGGFAFDPGDITPAPSQVNGAVTWDETVLSLTSFDVPGTIPPLAPGETFVVSDSSLVDATLTLEGGLMVALSIPLGPTTVSAPHILDLTPEVQSTSAGTAADFTVHLENLRSTSETFSFEVLGFDPADVAITASVTVGPGASADIPLSLATATTAPIGPMDFVVVATGDLGTEDQVWGTVDVTPNAAFPATTGGVLIDVDPTVVDAGKGSTVTVNVLVTNTGSRMETFLLSFSSPDGIAGTFAEPMLEVAAGRTATRTTQLILDIPGSIPRGLRDYMVTATADGDPANTATTTASVDVAPYGVQVELSPDLSSVTPSTGTTLTAAITNPGTGTASFDLTLVGALGPWACFDNGSTCAPTHSVNLIPGRTVEVPVVIGSQPSLPQQRSMIGVRASAFNIINRIEVVGVDYALVDILGERGMGLELNPTTITDDSLAPIPFSVLISNLGNLCDERYTMTFTSDPVGVEVMPESTTFLVPGGATASVGAYAMAPAFGTYTIHVEVETDGSNPLCPSAPTESATADLTLVLNGTNVGPVANAGDDQQGTVGQSTVLDGTQSFDPDGGMLTYVWTFQSVPLGSSLTSADLVGANTATPSFVPDVVGAYVLALDVSDGQLNDGDTVTVLVVEPPIADAGPDQEVVTGELVQHDGSASYDPDGDLITFEWMVLGVPAGSSVDVSSLSDPADAQPTFTPDVDGEYTFSVTVSDGLLTDTDTVVIVAASSNLAPVADAGQDLGVLVGVATALDGRDSFDPDTGPGALTYSWGFLEVPAGSALTDGDIADRDQALASFTPDAMGVFVLGLAVGDGDRTSSDTAEVRAGVGNIPPVADAGPDQMAELGGSPAFDGSGSKDADRGPSPLTYAWRFVAIPAASALTNADLEEADTEVPFFTPDVPGTFVLRLLVSDGEDTDEENVAVQVKRGEGLLPEADVFLRRGSRAVNEGASRYLIVRGDTARILLKFDEAAIAAELGGRQLGSAQLELQIREPDAQGWGSGEPLHVYRMLEPWVEGNGFHYRVRPLRNRTRGAGSGVTWWCGTDSAIENDDRDCDGTDWRLKPVPRNNPRGFTNPWLTPATDEVLVANRQSGKIVLDVTADVQAFLSGAPNHGWAILKAPKTGTGTLWLDSREGAVPPRLVITPLP